MRILKFRVWDKLQNNFVENARGNNWINDKILTFNIPDYWTIQQFTGLLDLNKQEIYEGDIVETVEGIELGDKYINKGVVKYDEYFAAYGVAPNLDSDCTDYFLDTGSCRYPKIIGNVFENPELLK